jgi:polar amino acid transport system substrate-binding protein
MTYFHAPVARHALFRLSCCVLIALCAPLAHAEVRLYVDDVAPYFYREGGAEKGLFHDVLKELSARLGRADTVSALPLARELEVLRRAPEALGVVARMPEREASYTWLFKVLDEEIVLITSADSKVDISSPTSARQLRVGVLRGSPSESTARQLGYTNLSPVAHSEENAGKLAIGRIDAWIAVWPVAVFAQKQAGLDLGKLRRGAVLRSFGFYCAASRQFDPAEAEKWRSAFHQMQADGSYSRILRNYDYATPALCQGQRCVSSQRRPAPAHSAQ